MFTRTTIDFPALRSALQQIAAVKGKRPSSTQYYATYVLVRYRNGELLIDAGDTFCWMRVSMNARGEDDWSLVVPFNKLHQSVMQHDAGTLSYVKKEESSLCLFDGGEIWEIEGIEPQAFTTDAIPEVSNAMFCSFRADEFARLLKRTLFVVDFKLARIAPFGVYSQIATQFRFGALRIAVSDVDLVAEGKIRGEFMDALGWDGQVPAIAMRRISQVLSKEGTIRFSRSSLWNTPAIQCSFGEMVVWMPFVAWNPFDNRLSPLSNLVPKRPVLSSAYIDLEDAQKAIQSVAALTNALKTKQPLAIEMVPEQGIMRISAEGKSRRIAEIRTGDVVGSPISVRFHAKTLLDILKRGNPGDKILLAVQEEGENHFRQATISFSDEETAFYTLECLR